MQIPAYPNQGNFVNRIEDELFGSGSLCPACKSDLRSISCFPHACGCPSLDSRLGIERADCTGGGFICSNPSCGCFLPFGFEDQRRMRMEMYLEVVLDSIGESLEREGRSLPSELENLLRRSGAFLLTGDPAFGMFLDLDVRRVLKLLASPGEPATKPDEESAG